MKYPDLSKESINFIIENRKNQDSELFNTCDKYILHNKKKLIMIEQIRNKFPLSFVEAELELDKDGINIDATMKRLSTEFSKIKSKGKGKLKTD